MKDFAISGEIVGVGIAEKRARAGEKSEIGMEYRKKREGKERECFLLGIFYKRNKKERGRMERQETLPLFTILSLSLRFSPSGEEELGG